MIRRWLPIAVGAGIVVWLAALVLLAITAEGSQRFGELYLVILLINVTGVIALFAFVLLRVSMRRSRQRREEVRELRRRAQAAPPVTDDRTAAAQRYDDEVDDVTMTQSPDYPTEERRT